MKEKRRNARTYRTSEYELENATGRRFIEASVYRYRCVSIILSSILVDCRPFLQLLLLLLRRPEESKEKSAFLPHSIPSLIYLSPFICSSVYLHSCKDISSYARIIFIHSILEVYKLLQTFGLLDGKKFRPEITNSAEFHILFILTDLLTFALHSIKDYS